MRFLIYLLIFLELIVATLGLNYTEPNWKILLPCLIFIAILTVIIVNRNDKESIAMKKHMLKIEVNQSIQNDHFSTFIKKASKIYSKNVLEMKAVIEINNSLNIISGYNLSSVTDSGSGKISLNFIEPFPDILYNTNIESNRGEVKYTKIEKREQELLIEFDESDIEWIQVFCWDHS